MPRFICRMKTNNFMPHQFYHAKKKKLHATSESTKVSFSTTLERGRGRELQLPTMAAASARKRSSAKSSPQTQTSDAVSPPPSKEDLSLPPPKLGFLLLIPALSILPFFYLLFFHYQIDSDLRRSILINAAMSFAGFVAAVRLIPVASRYVLRRNMFGFDINKKGTPQGAVKVWAFLL